MITRCTNGHWYDTAVNKVCPHCKQQSERLGLSLNDIEEDDHTVSIAEVDISLGEQLGAIIGGNSVGGNLTSDIPNPFMGGIDIPASSDDDDKTISFGFFGITTVQPVVGWLVCMNGSEKGKDYRLHTGKNFIGRSTSMDVVLIDDKTISRDRHCSVIYDPKGNAYYISAEAGNLSYLNDELIQDSKQIYEGDTITIGKTNLMFIPFCREGRTWKSE